MSASALAPGTVIGDHFIIRRKLGGGGMGEVFLAENLNIEDKKYAIKVLLREYTGSALFVDLLRSEASKQARLEHDNVVGMYDFFAWEGHYCLLQSYIKGQDLKQILTEHPDGLPREQALDLMCGILAGLDYAHQNGILHCDVKPANVIIDAAGRPHVTDFGISRDIGATPAALRGAGTADYMSPEQLQEPFEVDHRADVYAAGVVFFQMLSGKAPFHRSPDTASKPLTQSLFDAPDIRTVRADIPEAIARIVATALQPDPDHRFQGCQDFALAIQEFRKRERFKRTWLPAIVVSAIIAIGAAGWTYHWRQEVLAADADKVEQNRLEAEALKRKNVETIAADLHSAAVAMSQACDAAFNYQKALKGIELAQGNDNPTMVKTFQEKAKAQEELIGKRVLAYGKILGQLGGQELELVRSGLAQADKADPAVQPFLQPLKADIDAQFAKASRPTAEQMMARCAGGN